MAPTEIAVMMQSQIAKLWIYPPSIRGMERSTDEECFWILTLKG